MNTVRESTPKPFFEEKQRSDQHNRPKLQRPTSAPPRHQTRGDYERQQHRAVQKFTQEESENFDEWKDESSIPDEPVPIPSSRDRNDRPAPLSKNFINSKFSENKRQSHRTEILADKYHWKKIHSKENNSALSSLASRRVQQYLHTSPSSSSPRNYSPTEAIADNKFQTKTIGAKDSKILSSGSSSLEIADAFLQSTLGQELIDNYRPDYQQQQSHDQIHDMNDHDDDRQPQGDKNQRKKSVNATSEDRDFYRAYYSQDWKSRKGGWVGDFSSRPTHPLSNRHEDEGGKRMTKY
jgi:hypothetical protein